MKQSSLVLLYPAAAIAAAALVYAANRSRLLRTQLELERHARRLDDLENYLLPLREYSKHRRSTP